MNKEQAEDDLMIYIKIHFRKEPWEAFNKALDVYITTLAQRIVDQGLTNAQTLEGYRHHLKEYSQHCLVQIQIDETIHGMKLDT